MTELEKKERLALLAQGLIRHITGHPALKAAFEHAATPQDREDDRLETLILADASAVLETASSEQRPAVHNQIFESLIRRADILVNVMNAAYGPARVEPHLVRYFEKARKLDHTRGDGYGEVLESLGALTLATPARKAEREP